MMGSVPLKSFIQAKSDYSSITTYENVGGTIFKVALASVYCDSVGNVSYPDSSYMRIDIIMTCTSSANDTLYIGTQNNPFSKVYFSTGL